MTTRREFNRFVLGSLGLPLAAAADGPPPPKDPPMTATGSDLGSLAPFLESQSPRGVPPLSYLHDKHQDLAAWRAEAKSVVLDLLRYAPPPCDPAAEVLSRVARDGYVEERVRFNTTPDIRLEAAVLLPEAARQPAPALVALHDHGAFFLWGKEKLLENEREHPALTAFRQQSYGGRSIAADLARQGYVVIVIDMFYWGERRLRLDGDPPHWHERSLAMTGDEVTAFNQRSSQSIDLVQRALGSTGITWPGVMIWDDLRTVDYLVTRPEVDPNRLGCVGLSVGGFRSCHLAALDERIQAGVVVGWMASFPRQLPHRIRNTIGHMMLIPGLYQRMDYPDVAALACPRALLVINGLRDGLFDLDGVRDCFAQLAAVYRKAGVPDKVRTQFYDGPHEFNPEMQAVAWDWLARWVRDR